MTSYSRTIATGDNCEYEYIEDGKFFESRLSDFEEEDCFGEKNRKGKEGGGGRIVNSVPDREEVKEELWVVKIL